MDAGTFVVHDSIVEEIIGLNAVSMSVDAELQTGELLKIVMENICHIVVELFRERSGMHGYYSLGNMVWKFFNSSFRKVKSGIAAL